MSVRRWYVQEALRSYPSLKRVLGDLTEAEVLHVLELESQTLRRRSVIDRLISKAVRLNELSYGAELRKKYGGS